MMLLYILLSLFSVTILFYLWFKPVYGLYLYLIYYFLAPYLLVGPVVLYNKTFALLLITIFLFRYKKYNIKLNLLAPFFLYYILELIFVFSSSFSVLISLDNWFLDISKVLFCVLLYIVLRNNEIEDYKFTKLFYIIFSVIILYGLLLTLTPGLNPYQIILQPIFGGEFNYAYASGFGATSEETGINEMRAFGRISSFFAHPMTYAINLGFFLIYCFDIYQYKKKLFFSILIIVLFSIFITGSRTPIAAVLITFSIIILYLKRVSYLIYALLIFYLLYSFIELLPHNISNYLMSIIDSDSSDVNGSNLSMRIEQLNGCLKVIDNFELLGRGYSWSEFYNGTYGQHPLVLYFESLIFVIICNTGFLGLFVWTIFLCFYFVNLKNIKDKCKRLQLFSIMIFYLSFTMITGDYNYLPYLILFYVLIINKQYKFRNVQGPILKIK